MNHYWLTASMLLHRDILRFWRDRSRVAGFALTPVVFWLVVGSGYSDFARFLPGALVLTVMFSAIFSAMSLIEDRKEGFLLSVLASPAPRPAIVLGKITAGALIAAVQTAAFLLLATLGGTLYPNSQIFFLLGVFLLVAVGFTAAGFLIAWLVASPQGFHAIINLIFVPLWMVSGAIFPIGESQTGMRWLMLLNPVTYAHEAVARGLGLAVPDGHPVTSWLPFVVVVLSAIFMFGAAVVVINRPSERNLL